jgi:hypothetical protein
MNVSIGKELHSFEESSNPFILKGMIKLTMFGTISASFLDKNNWKFNATRNT